MKMKPHLLSHQTYNPPIIPRPYLLPRSKAPIPSHPIPTHLPYLLATTQPPTSRERGPTQDKSLLHPLHSVKTRQRIPTLPTYLSIYLYICTCYIYLSYPHPHPHPHPLRPKLNRTTNNQKGGRTKPKPSPSLPYLTRLMYATQAPSTRQLQGTTPICSWSSYTILSLSPTTYTLLLQKTGLRTSTYSVFSHACLNERRNESVLVSIYLCV